MPVIDKFTIENTSNRHTQLIDKFVQKMQVIDICKLTINLLWNIDVVETGSVRYIYLEDASHQ